MQVRVRSGARSCARRKRAKWGGLAGAFLEKGGKKNAKQERFRKKVHLFLEIVM